MTTLFPISGYVLAGGRSSRMGTDKTLLQLAGKPLIEHTVTKLHRVCAEVHILSSNPALAAYGPLVPDIHPDCGPVGGMEAALTQSRRDWNLFLAVDLPFLPSAFVHGWATHWMQCANDGARIRLFSDEGHPHPTFCLLHKDVLPFLSGAISARNLKLMRVLEEAGSELERQRGLSPGTALWNAAVKEPPGRGEDMSRAWGAITPAQEEARSLWFANLNTPDDFALAAAHVEALDT
jgi:molybdenum cofactor guanylyltransferase